MIELLVDRLRPYLLNPRVSHEESAAIAKNMAEHLQFKFGLLHIRHRCRGLGQPGWDVGSCSKVEFWLDGEWNSVPFDEYEKSVYAMLIVVSNRGPFITSIAAETFRATDGTLPPYQTRNSPRATLRCREFAEELAAKLKLEYLDPDALRAIELDETQLIDDAAMSIDYSDPTVLNILFDEQI